MLHDPRYQPPTTLQLLAFLVIGMRPAMVAKLLESQPIRRLLLVLGRHVIAILASRAL
jgi:hypothetical protein